MSEEGVDARNSGDSRSGLTPEPGVVVIGGGIAGLGAARRCKATKPRGNVVLLERQQRLGGKILTERTDGFVIEAGPEALIASRPRAVELCRELGLGDRLAPPNDSTTGTAILIGGRLRALPDGMAGMLPSRIGPLVRSDLFTIGGKARMALEACIPPSRTEQDETIASFVKRRLGREAHDRLVEPLVGGIYAGDPGQLSLEATLPYLRRVEQTHGGLIRGMLANRQQARGGQPRKSPFLAPRVGLAELAEALQRDLRETGVTIRTGAAVVAVESVPDGYAIRLECGASLNASAVILATPAPVAADIVAGMDNGLSGALRAVPHASVATIALAYRHEDIPAPFGWSGYLTPRLERRPVRACTVVSEKWAGRAPKDMMLLRLSVGGAEREDPMEMGDAALVRLARLDLADVLGITAAPAFSRVYRWASAMPQYVLGHRERIAWIDDRLASRWPGLALAGNAYHGVGISDSLKSGERAAERVASLFTGNAA